MSVLHGAARTVSVPHVAQTGTFADPAQLYGLFDRLQDLGIPILSVNPVD